VCTNVVPFPLPRCAFVASLQNCL